MPKLPRTQTSGRSRRAPTVVSEAPAPPVAPPSPPGARDRILEAAAGVFAQRGFRDATVREIASKAGVGVGLMNYHFGEKERLYEAVLDRLFGEAFAKYPLEGALASGRPAPERLRAAVRAILGRLLGDTGVYRQDSGGRLLAMELANPSPAMDEVIQRYVRPQKEALAEIVAALLGPVALRDPWRVQCCVLSVAAQCLHYAYARPLIERLAFASARPDERLELLTEHITRFSLGGIRAVRDGKDRS